MDRIRLPEGAYVVVCDGRKALVLANAGDADFPNLKTVEAEKQELPPTSALGADAPGRVYQSVGAVRSSVEQTDWHDKAEEDFLRALAGRIDRLVAAGEASRLVVVAPPRQLGVLRHAYTDRIRASLLAEIDKDLTALPLHEIERHIAGPRRSR